MSGSISEMANRKMAFITAKCLKRKKAQEAFTALPISECLHHDSVKNAILKAYYLEPEGSMVAESPPTAEARVRFVARPQVVGSLQYRTLMNCMYWFPLLFQLPVVI